MTALTRSRLSTASAAPARVIPIRTVRRAAIVALVAKLKTEGIADAG